VGVFVRYGGVAAKTSYFLFVAYGHSVAVVGYGGFILLLSA
jgi:hypothetical protein